MQINKFSNEASRSVSQNLDFKIMLRAKGSQGLTLAMCPLARTHFLGGRASSGHNN